MSSIQTERRIPPQIKANVRVHHARRYRPSWLREGVVGDFGGDPLIVLVSPAFKSELSNHGTMTLRLVAKSCPVTTWQIASAIFAPPAAEGSISLA